VQKEYVSNIQKNAIKAQGATKEDVSVIRLVDDLLSYGFINHASDIHIEPAEKEIIVRFRIDGILYDVLNFPKTILDMIVTRIKILSKLRTDESRSAQDGKIMTEVEGTIEDPVEYSLDGVNQIQVNPQTNLTFAAGLRSLLRQDPDIIMVGEIRDNETAGIAINAAMTGHLVLSTLHTNDAATSLPRLIDMHIEPFLVASTVNIIIGQRLVRKICMKCIYSYTLNPKELEDLRKEINIDKYLNTQSLPEIRLYKGKGCEHCNHTGYSGRIGIFEVLQLQENIKELIINRADSDQIAKQARANGMTTMLEDGFVKSIAGKTTIEEVFRVTKQ